MQERFTITARDPHSRARTGILQTAHGNIETPVFMPVGTRATVKALTPDELQELGAQIILGNTYHLALQPGHALIARMGGLHRFMSWDGPILTDSGGFQVFSLVYGGIANEIKGRRIAVPGSSPSVIKLTDEGVLFRSYVDGSHHFFTPEHSITVQHALGADIILCFDELPPFHVGYDYTARSMERTHAWEQRSLDTHHLLQSQQPDASPQMLFGIVHGGIYPDLRRESAENIRSLPFEGICIGGSLGANKAQMYEVVGMTVPHLPENRPRHLLGIGDVDDLFTGVAAGIDMFDCVTPTRLGRHGTALVRNPEHRWRMNINNATFRHDERPIQEGCQCLACRRFSRAYIHYLFRVKEILGIRLVSLHNVTFLVRMMQEIRESIKANTFEQLRQAWLGSASS